MSSTSLYGNVSNVTVSSKNLTTLYNATTGNTVVANVPDRNFTTLYSGAGQTDIKPTRAYGNANVEAFLNAGTDGVNTVQNINMTGTLSVGGQTNLGPVGNVHIDGGNSGYVLTTDGDGNLIWAEPQGGLDIVPYIHFDVTSNGNNQTFTNALLSAYSSNVEFNVMKNGVNIEPSLYVKTGTNTFQVNIPLVAGDDIDVLAMGGSGGSVPAGSNGQIQFNAGYGFGADANFTVDSSTGTLTATFFSGDGSNITNLNGSNVTSEVANANYATYSGTANIANIASVANSVSVGNVVGIGNIATVNLTGSTSNILLGDGSWGIFGTTSNANYANFAGNVVNSSQPNITVLGSLTSLTVQGTTSIQEAKEKVTVSSTGSSGTINYDVLTQAIVLKTANATSNFLLNVRGSSVTTLDSVLSVGQSITISFINVNGATGYFLTGLQIDGSSQIIQWFGGVAPISGTANGYDMYNLNIIKIGPSSYVVFGLVGDYA